MYIGKTPTVGNFQKCDALTASATADYTLQVGSSNVSPESVNHMIVSLNGVIQQPGATGGFTVSGSTLSFTSALTSNDTIDFVILLGNVLDIGTPSDDTVSTAKIQDDAVTTAKIVDDAVTSAKLGTGDMTFPNGDLIFGTAGKGVCLGVTSNTDANTLDDYEEGTWTPAGSNYTGTLGSVSANYTKIGRAVYIHLFCSTTDDTSSGSAFQITGLPFTAAGSYFTTSTCHYNNPNGAAISGASVQTGSTTVRMLKKTDAASPTWANWAGSDTNSGELHFTFVYQV